MSEINPAQSLLQTLQVLRAEASRLESPQAAGKPLGAGFGDLLQQVNAQQQRATELAAAVERGDEQANLVEAMIAMQRARVSFEALKQVRNKALTAYQDIMNMSL